MLWSIFHDSVNLAKYNRDRWAGYGRVIGAGCAHSVPLVDSVRKVLQIGLSANS